MEIELLGQSLPVRQILFLGTVTVLQQLLIIDGTHVHTGLVEKIQR